MEGSTFHKAERLCKQELIGDLFTFGETFLAYPLKIVFLKTENSQDYPALAAFTVSKRNFKHAVKRNLLKRRMREAYRLNKSGFYAELASKYLQIAIMFVYIGKDVVEYPVVEKSMKSALKKLVAKF